MIPVSGMGGHCPETPRLRWYATSNNIMDNKVKIVTSYKYPFQKPDIFVNEMEYYKFLKLVL